MTRRSVRWWSSTPGRRSRPTSRRSSAPAPTGIATVVLTHRHLDHSEGAAALGARAGCGVRAADPEFRVGPAGLDDGDVLAVPGGSVAVLATPGHTSDSRSLLLTGADGVVRLLTGDMVLGQGTTVITHPDGNLGAYLESLARLQHLVTERGVAEILPGHGPVVTDPAGVAGLLPRPPPGAAGPGTGGPGRRRAYAGRGRRPGVRRRRSPGVAGRGAIRTRATGLSRNLRHEDSGSSDSGHS